MSTSARKSRVALSRRPMTPKSTSRSEPSAATKMFPGCGSPWKKPSRKTWLNVARAARATMSAGSWPAAARASASPSAAPSTRSVVSTRRAVRRQSTFGTPRLASPAKFSASSAAAAPSRDRFISTVTASAKTSTDSTRRKRRHRGRAALHRAGEPEKQLEIAPERALDAGPQHLDRDRTPSEATA